MRYAAGPTGQPFAATERLARWAENGVGCVFVPQGVALGWESGCPFGARAAGARGVVAGGRVSMEQKPDNSVLCNKCRFAPPTLRLRSVPRTFVACEGVKPVSRLCFASLTEMDLGG